MLTSFLEKSRPINFLIFGGLIFLSGLLHLFTLGEAPFSWVLLPYFLFQFVLCLLFLFILNFIIVKNHLTEPTNLALFFFSGFLIMLPEVFFHEEITIANLFLLLAFRRIISLSKDTNASVKIFDASIWISAAALFYFWSLILFIPLWIAIIQKPNSNYKQLLMPFVGFIMIFLLGMAYHILANDSFLWFFDLKKSISLDFSRYNQIEILFPATIVFAFLIWASSWKIFTFKSVSFKERPKQILLFYIAVALLAIALAAPEKTGAEMLFIFPPVAIVTANYFEKDKNKHWKEKDKLELLFKELLLWLVVLVILISLFL